MKLLSMSQAADRIGCSRGHVYNLVAAGKLRRFDIGLKSTKTRVSDEDVEQYIAECELPVGGDAA